MAFGDWQAFLDETVRLTEQQGSLSLFHKLEDDRDRIDFCMTQKFLEKEEWIESHLVKLSKRQKDFKSSDKSIELRQTGNRYFQKKCNNLALQNYNQSIQLAPYHGAGKSEMYAVAVANRSAVLLHMNEYQTCLRDIDEALHSGYPASLTYKLMQRRAQCLLQLQEYAQATKAFEEVLTLLESQLDLDKRKKENLIAEVKSQMCGMPAADNLKSRGRKQGHDRQKEAEIRVSQQANPVLVQASSTVQLQRDARKGRYLMANEQIEAGDVLIAEKPFAAVLLPTHDHSHCHHCCATFIAPLPCRQCDRVLYCSVSCRDQSWQIYHQLECPYLDLLRSVGVSHLSLRIVVVAGLQFLKNYQSKLAPSVSSSSTHMCAGISDDRTYSGNYDSVYHLMSHSDNIEAEDQLQYTMTAVLMLKCLQHAGFFDIKLQTSATDTHSLNSKFGDMKLKIATDKPSADQTDGAGYERTDQLLHKPEICCNKCGNKRIIGERQRPSLLTSTHDALDKEKTKHAEKESLMHKTCDCPELTDRVDAASCGETRSAVSKEQLLIGGLLLRHIQQLICNAHAITELQATHAAADVDIQSQVRIATAIYPTASLMNHSCDPTIISSFQNDTLIVRAVKAVPPGGQIFSCYGPHWKRMRWAERQAILLGQYFFLCECHACQDGEKAEKPFKAFRCCYCEGWVDETNMNKCAECGKQNDVTMAIQQFSLSNSHFDKGVWLIEGTEIKAGLAEMLKCLQIRNRILYKHNRDLAEVEDHAARCFSMLGKYKIAATYLLKSVAITEAIYGSESIELANELHKYAQVLFNGRQIPAVLDVISRAVSIFRCHYGSGCSEIKELTEMSMCIEEYTANRSMKQ